MGRREAWSADRTGDTRTKPTRWEFQQARGDDHQEKLEDHRLEVDATQQASHVEMEEEEQRNNRATKAKWVNHRIENPNFL